MNTRVLALGVLVATPLVGVLFANLDRNPQAIETPLVGTEAPPFNLQTLGAPDKAISLASFRGRPVVVNFWASWCVPCQVEHPVLLEAARSNPDVAFVGIVYEDEIPRALAFLEGLGSAYPSVVDPQASVAIAYGIAGVPETYFIDRGGRIVAKYASPLTRDVMAQGLQLVRRSS